MSKNPTKIISEPDKQEIFIIREFEAPREIVFKAFTDPKLISQWLGPKKYTMTIDKYDSKSGGSYRYIHSDLQGQNYVFKGVIHEVTAPERIIQTFEFEFKGMTGSVSLEYATFEALPGNRTRLTTQSVFRSVASRDGMLRSNMESGMNESHQRLDELLLTLMQKH